MSQQKPVRLTLYLNYLVHIYHIYHSNNYLKDLPGIQSSQGLKNNIHYVH